MWRLRRPGTVLLAVRFLRQFAPPPRLYVPAPILASLSHLSSLLPGTMAYYSWPRKVGFSGRLHHLEHNFGHGDQHLSEAFFTLNLLAFFMHQIFDLVDGLYQRVRTFFSSRRAFWDEVRSTFRLFLFTSWDQVLVRMNSPPQPLPPYQER